MGNAVDADWTIVCQPPQLILMADLGQVTPFNASVPHLSNGGNNTDLPHRGVVRHCKPEVVVYSRVLCPGCPELSRRGQSLGLSILSKVGSARRPPRALCPPPRIKVAASSRCLKVFQECWHLHSSDMLRRFQGEGTEYFLCLAFTKKLFWTCERWIGTGAGGRGALLLSLQVPNLGST